MSTPTAAWDTPALMTSLARSGWGDLDGARLAGVRRVLTALVDLTDHRSGEATVTRSQVADTAGGLSVRWTSRCLRVLEDMGLITWSRGWLDRGRPRPGIVRISKRALAALARAARRRLEPRRTARALETTKRIKTTLRWTTVVPHAWHKAAKQQNPLSVRGELSSPLLPYRELSPTAGRSGHVPTTMTRKEPDMMWCIHGNDPQSCEECRQASQPTTPPPPLPPRNPPLPPRNPPRQAGTRIICGLCGSPIPVCGRQYMRNPDSHHRPEPVTVPATEALS